MGIFCEIERNTIQWNLNFMLTIVTVYLHFRHEDREDVRIERNTLFGAENEISELSSNSGRYTLVHFSRMLLEKLLIHLSFVMD